MVNNEQHKQMKVLGIIPARYASTRFPGKPLAMIGDKCMIQHVYQRVSGIRAISSVIVATDDQRIADCVVGFGGKVMLTSDRHRSGTDRCGEVIQRMGKEAEQYDIVINIQGDEPFVEASQLETLIQTFRDRPDIQIATLKKRIGTQELLFSPNAVKVVTDLQGNALYFSRQPIPHQRGVEQCKWQECCDYFKHIGIYAFRRATLEQLVRLQQSPLERSESLEQLRWLENGYKIAVRDTSVENVSVDTEEDLSNLIKKLQQ